METPLVSFQIDQMIATVTLNRPNQLNALSISLLKDLQRVFSDLKNEEVRAVVLTGSGEKAFAAGADISEMKDLDQEGARLYSEFGNQVLREIELFPAPVIAAVNGYALGGGFELALACDLIIASDHAVFAFPEVSLGVTPGFGGTQRLSRIIGIMRAKDLIFTTRRINAQEALQLGIVLDVFDRSEFLGKVLSFASSISRHAPIAVASAKRAISQGIQCDLDSGLSIEAEAFGRCFDSEDQKMAMAAFLAKQKPGPFVNR